METELLLKIAEFMGKVNSLSGQITDVTNRLNQFMDKHSDDYLNVTRELGEINGTLDVLKTGFSDLVSAARTAGIEITNTNSQDMEQGK